MRRLHLLPLLLMTVAAVPMATNSKFFQGSSDVQATGSPPLKSLKASIALCQVSQFITWLDHSHQKCNNLLLLQIFCLKEPDCKKFNYQESDATCQLMDMDAVGGANVGWKMFEMT